MQHNLLLVNKLDELGISSATINIPIRELHGIKDEKGVIIGEFVICDGIQNELKTLLNQFNNQ